MKSLLEYITEDIPKRDKDIHKEDIPKIDKDTNKEDMAKIDEDTPKINKEDKDIPKEDKDIHKEDILKRDIINTENKVNENRINNFKNVVSSIGFKKIKIYRF